MSIHVLSAGGKMPTWVVDACADYNKRVSAEYKINWQDLPLETRSKNQSVSNIRARETRRLVEAVPAGSYLIALDEKGKHYSSTDFSTKLEKWMQSYKHISFVIGGPDGLDFDTDLSVGSGANSGWDDSRLSLSAFTFPHSLVRVLLAEQIYRAWSLRAGHPYHRA